MLHLTFENPVLPKHEVGPFESLEVTAQTLWGMPGRVPLATHEDSMWVTPERDHYTSIAIRTPCLLRFKHEGEQCSTEQGNAAEARLSDGALYHGGKLIAKLDESKQVWRIYEDRVNCASAEIVPPAN